MSRFLVLPWFLLLVAGCTTPVPGDYYRDATVSPAQLLRGDALLGNQAPELTLPREDVIGLDEEMREFAAIFAPDHMPRERRGRSLLNAMISSGFLGLEYRSEKTYNARDTFHRQEGNCVSFTNLFVALARSAGLRARFQLVHLPPTWEQEEEFFVLRRHINAVVDLGHERELVVDFNRGISRSGFNAHAIPDKTAFAHYYSNLGVARLQAGDTLEAFRYFKQALAEDPDMGAAWVNLGALYSRNGIYDHAEAAYLQAARRDPGEDLAYSNLARLYELKGQWEKAAFFAHKVRSLRESNPYHHYARALHAHEDGDYRESNRLLAKAIKLKEDEPQFYELRRENNRRLAEHAENRFNENKSG